MTPQQQAAIARCCDHENLVGELVEALQETMFALSDAVGILYCASGEQRITAEFGEKVGRAREKFHAVMAKAKEGAQS